MDETMADPLLFAALTIEQNVVFVQYRGGEYK